MHAAPLPPPRPRNPRRIPSLNREQQLGGGLRGVHRYSSERQQEMAAQMANWPTYLLQTEKLESFMERPQASGQRNHLWLRKVRLQALRRALRRPFFAVMANKTNSLQSE